MVHLTSTVVHDLLERGFLSFESVVDGDVVVAEATSRHRNFAVMRKRDASYFVKQIQPWQPQAASTLQREAHCYWLAQQDPTLATLAPLLPKYYGFDAKRGMLILELLPEAENLSLYHRRLGQFPVAIATQLGQTLGRYHHAASASLQKDNPHYAVFPRQIPWIFSFHQGTSPFSQLSGANTQMQEILRQYPEFPQALDALRNQWQVNTLMHGDMKWENCLVYPQKNGELGIKLVDWEIADFGDACWDVGGLLQAYLSFWIMAMPITSGASPEDLVAQAPYSLAAVQPSMQAFWTAYSESIQITM